MILMVIQWIIGIEYCLTGDNHFQQEVNKKKYRLCRLSDLAFI